MTYELIGRLTTELHDTAEALAASTQARLLQVDTIQAQRARIAELEAENERLRRATYSMATLPVLTDRPAAHLEYDTSTWGVVYRENGR